MARALLFLAVLTPTLLVLPALAQDGGGCPDTCPDGMVRDNETGKCEPYTPLV